ncbi:MAG TPA: FHA domain-containing protein [Pseudomonadales bacterium]|nr:FHA domain-containing protein [Pseudomonadales bacterium]
MALLVQLIDGVVGNKFTLDKQLHTIGRHPQNEIFLDDVAVSVKHAVIEARENSYLDGYCDFTLKDLGSTNGTFVNDERITEQKLVNGDLVRIVWNTFRFIDDNEMDLEKTTQILMGSTF